MIDLSDLFMGDSNDCERRIGDEKAEKIGGTPGMNGLKVTVSGLESVCG